MHWRGSPFVVVTFMLMACDQPGVGESETGGTETGDVPCDMQANSVAGSATFEGVASSFDDGSVIIYTNGPIDEPCLKFIEIFVRGETASMDFFVRYDEASDGFVLTGAGYGEPTVSHVFGTVSDHLSKFDLDVELGPVDGECPQVSFDAMGTAIDMYRDSTDDPDTYVLSQASVSIAGTWSVTWLDEGVCGYN